MKHLIIISIIILIASLNYMLQEFPINRPESESFSKMLMSEAQLKNYYTDTLYHKEIGSDPIKSKDFVYHLKNYYCADFPFLLAYCIIFYWIAKSLYTSKTGILQDIKWYKIFVALIIVLGISDIAENLMMLNYIDHNFENHTKAIVWTNVAKYGLFAFLMYYLVIYNIKFVLKEFIKLF